MVKIESEPCFMEKHNQEKIRVQSFVFGLLKQGHS